MAPAPGKHRLPHQLAGQHGLKQRPKRDSRERGSARERGYSAAWDRFSRQFLMANPICEYCLAKGRIVAARVTDHDIPHRGDPDLFWDNTFTALCAACHNGPKARAEARLSGDALRSWVRSQKDAGHG